MKAITIKQAAQSYADSIAQSDERKRYCMEDFTAGARWRINSVWHDTSEELPEYEKSVLSEYEINGRKDYVFSHRSNCPHTTTDEQGFCFYINGAKITRWAYIEDLLPNKEG